MKKLLVLFCIGAMVGVSCNMEKGRYVDLRTGEKIEIEKDPQTGTWINKETDKPVYIYVDTKTDDTIYGRTGEVINGHVVKTSDNLYWYEMDDEYKVKRGDYKYKVEEDGDIKIKTDDKKIKIDGETGEKKVKKDD